LINLSELAPGKAVTMVIEHSNGSKEEIKLSHSYNAEQLKWFKAGSALNLIRANK
jgi:aconitate hydratase